MYYDVNQALATVKSLHASKSEKEAALRVIRAYERHTGETVMGGYNGRK